MNEHSTATTTIGMDIGDKYCQLFVLDNASREELEQAKVKTTPEALSHYFEWKMPCRVVMEVGTHSGWISRKLVELGHEVLVADPRRVRALAGDQDKDDPLDAEFLARIGCTDVKLLKPVHLRSEETQVDLVLVRARDLLVKLRTMMTTCVRGFVKASGDRLPSCSSERFHKLEEQLPTLLQEALTPVMACVKTVTKQVRVYDGKIEERAQEKYPQTERLRQVDGVGPVTSLAYVLVIEDPSRFKTSRAVGAYLGLCPRRKKSGESDPELGISKRGDRLLRRLLVQAAQRVLGPFGKDSDLRRWGLAYCSRSKSKNAKKRAVIGVARKLAVLLHRLWVTGEDYEPLRLTQAQAQKQVA